MAQRKRKFDAALAALERARSEQVTERTYFKSDLIHESVKESQYDQLPEEYQEVCVEGALPLQFLGGNWLLLVVTSHWAYESALVWGKRLHRRWDNGALDRMSLATVKKMRGGYLPVACPDGTYLAVKILGVRDDE